MNRMKFKSFWSLQTNNNKRVANSCLELGLLGGQIAGWQASFWLNLHIWLAELLDGWMDGLMHN